MMKYDLYRDSEVYWLGEIPYSWSIKRVKDIFKSFGSGTTPNTSIRQYYDVQQVNWLTTGDIQNNEINSTKFKISEQAVKDYRLKLFPPESIAIGMYGQGKTRGSVAYLNISATSNQNAGIMYGPKECEPKYIFWWFIGNYESIRQLGNVSAIPNLNGDLVKNIPISCPSPKEQTAIANYLDTKTQAIDKKVSLLDKKIGYYQELRKSLINETVTKGLDKNLELQTSDLGFKTPKNWLRYRLKDLGSLFSGLSGKSGDDFNQDDNPDNKGFIPFTNIANNTYLKRDHLGTVVVYEGEIQNRVRRGDIFFLMSSEGYEDIGKSAALAEDIEETYLNSFCKGYRVNPCKTNPYFLNYLMLSDYYRQLLIVEGKGFTRINLKMEKVNDFLVYVPDTLAAQEEIVKFLDAKLDTIAKIITNLQTQITTLKELRKTLINDVVTGKIKVIQD